MSYRKQILLLSKNRYMIVNVTASRILRVARQGDGSFVLPHMARQKNRPSASLSKVIFEVNSLYVSHVDDSFLR